MRSIMSKLLTIFTFSILLFACSFNNMFLVPGKIEKEATRAKLIDYESQDTLIINFGNNFQPVFINNQNDTVGLGYKIESVLFDNEIGNTLNGWIISPSFNYNGSTILFLHGNAGNITSHYSGVVPLIKKGFRIFIFDYSGFGFSEGKATRKNVLLDANSSLDYLISRKDLKVEKLLIYGQSLGGHLAATVAARNQDKIDGLIIEGAFSSHKDIAAEIAGVFGRILISEKYSGLKSIKQFKKPLLIIHSMEDEVIPFEMGRKLFANANEPKFFYGIKKCHICGPLYYADEITEKINEMVNTVTP